VVGRYKVGQGRREWLQLAGYEVERVGKGWVREGGGGSGGGGGRQEGINIEADVKVCESVARFGRVMHRRTMQKIGGILRIREQLECFERWR
jgi:hypothetical protein